MQLVESQDEDNKGNYYMFPKPADKNSKGILFEKGGVLNHKLEMIAKWGEISVNEVIELLNAMIETGLTDADLQTIKSKTSGNVDERRREKKNERSRG